MNYKLMQDYLLKILVAVSPFIYNPFADLPFRSVRETFFQIAMTGVVLCLVCRLIFSNRDEAKILPGGKSTRLLAFLFTVSAAAYWLSLIMNGAYALPVETGLNYMLGGLLFFVFLDSFSRDVGGWLTILTVVVFVNGGYAIIQFFGYDPLFGPHHAGPVYRPYLAGGFMDSPNMLAPLLVSFVPYLFCRWMVVEAGRKFFVSGLAVLFLLIPIALTRNVAGWVSLLAVLMALICFFSWYEYIKKTGRLYRLVFCWACVILLGAGAAANYLTAADATKSMKLQSIRERVTQNRAAWQMFKESPLVGKGPNYFYRHFVEYRRAVWFEEFPRRIPERPAHQVHNDYMQLLAEGGLLTALPLLTIILLLLGEQVGYLRRTVNGTALTERDLLAIGAVGGLWSIMVNGIGNFPFHVAPLAVTALFWAALSHRLIRYPSDTPVGGAVIDTALAGQRVT